MTAGLRNAGGAAVRVRHPRRLLRLRPVGAMLPSRYTMDRDGEVTMLLRAVAEGSESARGQLAELVFRELRGIAAHQLRGARGHTLQPTALVNEAWLKLAGAGADFDNRRHFLGVAAKAMRSVLIDHARRKRADKRGGDAPHGAIDDAILFLEDGEVDLLDLDDALDELDRDDPPLARLVEMRFFAGMTNAEIATLEQCSESTVERRWRLARARLRKRLGAEGGP